MSLISTQRFRIRPFDHADGHLITPQRAQSSEAEEFGRIDWAGYSRIGVAYTLLDSGRPVACAGCYSVWSGLGEAWAMVGDRVGPPAMVALVRGVRSFLEDASVAGYHRVQTQVKTDFEEGHRMARLLGFEAEGVLRKYGPDGSDYTIYSRV